MKSNDSSILNKIMPLLEKSEIEWQLVLNTVVTSYNCTTGTLHFLDEKNQLLQVQAHVGVPDFLIPKLSVIPIGKGMAGIAAERKEPVEMCNLQTDGSGVARPDAKETKVEGSIAAPLMLDNILYGVIGIGKRVPYDFTDAETQELMAIGEAICVLIKK